MLNPILASSALRRMRSVRTLLILGVYELVLLLVAVALMSSFVGEGQITVASMQYGMFAYIGIVFLQFALIVLVAPAMTASSIAGERERQTLELLLVTNTGSWQIVMGKLMESFAFMALLVVGSLPVMCLTTLLGAVNILQILTSIAFLLVCAFAAASVGLLASSMAKNTVGATILSYVFLLAIGVGTLLPVAFITDEMTFPLYDAAQYAAMTAADGLKLLPKLLMLNPALGLCSLMEAQIGLVQETIAIGWGRFYAMFMMMKKLGYGIFAMVNMGLMIALSFAFSGIAAVLVRPRRVKIRRRK